MHEFGLEKNFKPTKVSIHDMDKVEKKNWQRREHLQKNTWYDWYAWY